MKTQLFSFLVAILFANNSFGQDRTTVTATTDDISDNLDLRAVASLFGDASDLEDFERRLNDPKAQISNLDLNSDNQVDYLRVIESVEGPTHLIIIQSVLGRDVFQDVATVEVERDSYNNVQVQVVGDVYMYGQNYIYEPVYVHQPVIYSSFWHNSYRPYYSSYYWNYYPSYYYAWNPYPVYTYRNHIHQHINIHHHYNYVNVRNSTRAVAMHGTRRGNDYAVKYPERSFTNRNSSVTNRYELDQARGNNNVSVRNTNGTRTTLSAEGNRSTTAPRSASISAPRVGSTLSPKKPQSITRNVNAASAVKSSTAVRTVTPNNVAPATSRASVQTPRATAPRPSGNLVQRSTTAGSVRATTPARTNSRAIAAPQRSEVRSTNTVTRSTAPARSSAPSRSSGDRSVRR
ncbi:MAG TPA: hypothetical protein VGB44_11490 [Flavobacterium sp.]